MKSKFSAIPSLWALACVAALAQQTPPPPTTPPAEEEEKPAPNLPKLELGLGSWGLRGNPSTFRRYATIPRGLFVKELSYGLHEASPGLFGEMVFRGSPIDDYVAETTAVFGPRATRFDGSIETAEFMRPSVADLDPSQRKGVQASLRHSLSDKLDLVLDYTSRQLDKRFEGPAFNVHTRTHEFGGRLASDIGKGRLEVSASNRQFYDRTNSQPDTRTQFVQGSLLYPFGMLNLEGSYLQANIDQPGRSDAKVKTWRLDGDLPLSPDFDLQFGFRTQKYDLPQVINAYVRERATSYARIVGYLGGVSGHLSYKHVETERVREDHTFVDVPKFNTLEGRLSGKLGFGPRWTLRGSWQNLDGDAVMLTTDPRRLFWDDKANVQFKLDHGADIWNAYASYNFGFMENEARDIKVRTNGIVAGGAYQWRSNVDFFLEVTLENANTDFTEPNATVGLDSFFPSSRVTSLGANWAINPYTTLTTSFTELVTDNDNPIFDRQGNVYSRFASAHFTHRTKDGQELGLLIAPGRYADRVIRQLGYEATVVMVTAKWRF